MGIWMDTDSDISSTPGAVGFLEERTYHSRGGKTVYGLSPLPCRTNLSYEARLRGWCGETNNVSLYAAGLGRVSRVTGRGRTLVTPLRDDSPEAVAFLEAEGWPDLVVS